MQKPILIYCYDAYCGWCYGFSPVINNLQQHYNTKLDFEVLSGGMLTKDRVIGIEKIAPLIKQSYERVQDLTGIKFGEDFLWHINNPDKSDWVMNSEKSAIALCIFKDYSPEQQLAFASDIQYALNYEGRDLDDDEAYQHLIEKYNLPKEDFYTKLKSEEYKEKACYEFALCKQLGVNSFPQVLLQLNETKFYLVAKGYSPYENITKTIDTILLEKT